MKERRRNTSSIKSNGNKKKQAILFLTCIAITIIVILSAFSIKFQEKQKPFVGDQNNVGNVGSVKSFDLKASKFEYTPNIITVNRLDKVKIVVDNTDIPHGINIPELGISGNDILEFTADIAGEYTWYCNNYCGSGHGAMSGTLIVN